jgi:hypothetical protein
MLVVVVVEAQLGALQVVQVVVVRLKVALQGGSPELL